MRYLIVFASIACLASAAETASCLGIGCTRPEQVEAASCLGIGCNGPPTVTIPSPPMWATPGLPVPTLGADAPVTCQALGCHRATMTDTRPTPTTTTTATSDQPTFWGTTMPNHPEETLWGTPIGKPTPTTTSAEATFWGTPVRDTAQPTPRPTSTEPTFWGTPMPRSAEPTPAPGATITQDEFVTCQAENCHSTTFETRRSYPSTTAALHYY